MITAGIAFAAGFAFGAYLFIVHPAKRLPIISLRMLIDFYKKELQRRG